MCALETQEMAREYAAVLDDFPDRLLDVVITLARRIAGVGASRRRARFLVSLVYVSPNVNERNEEILGRVFTSLPREHHLLWASALLSR